MDVVDTCHHRLQLRVILFVRLRSSRVLKIVFKPSETIHIGGDLQS